jgi:hypothetical protein
MDSIIENSSSTPSTTGDDSAVACDSQAFPRFWWGNLRESDHLGDPGIDGRIILKRISKKWGGGMDRIELAQDRNRWRALVNAVMNLRVP